MAESLKDFKVKVFEEPKKDKGPFSKPQIMFILGSTGQGKSTLALNILRILDEQAKFQRAFWFCGNAGKDPTVKHLSQDFVVSSDPDLYKTLQSELISDNSKDRTLIVIDDLASNPVFNPTNPKDPNIQFVLSHRHHRVTLVYITHTWKQFNPKIRTQVSNIFAFPIRNESNKKAFLDELPVDKRKVATAMDIAESRNDHSFIWLNVPSRDIHVNFQKFLT
jgi:energy-coupling factor transporter ATP-binding protein EcfA2